jgi:hypothetical protein
MDKENDNTNKSANEKATQAYEPFDEGLFPFIL